MIRSRSLPFLLAAWVSLHAAPSPVAAQPDPFAAPGLHHLEVTTRSRWIHAAQPPASVWWVEGSDRFRVRVHRYRPSPGLARSYRFEGGGPEGAVATDRRNVVTQLSVVPEQAHYDLDREPGIDGMRPRSPGGSELHGQLGLVDTRLWEVPLPLPDGEIAPGTEWSDRTRLQAGSDGREEFVDLSWRFRAEGDTVLAGRLLPVVRAEADVVYRERRRVGDGAREEPTVVERDGRGRLTGRLVVDPELGLRAGGADTLRLEGTSTLVLQDGRRFVEPARLERIRRFALRDSAAWEAERARRSAEGARTRGGMVRPGPAASDVSEAPRDSLWQVWGTATDAEVRLAAERRLVSVAGVSYDAFRQELRRRRLAQGDSGAVLVGLPEGPGHGTPLSRERWSEVGPFLHDPGRAWRWGLHPRWTYSGLAGALLASSDVAGTDRERWACVPGDCEAILADMAASTEPRLREAAAVGRFARDPAGGWAELLDLQAAGSTVVDDAVAAGRGVGAVWPLAEGLGTPAPGADWRAWLAWMGGEVRVERSHLQALRFHAARTGRDALGEVAERWPRVEGDSARLVLGTLLRTAERIPLASAAELRTDLLSGDVARAEAARRQLGRLLSGADTLPPGEAASYLAPVLDSMLASGGVPWPTAETLGYRPTLGQGFHGAREVPVFLPREGSPPGLVEGRPVTLVDSATWADRDLRAGAVLVEFSPARRIGDLVYLGWSWSAWLPREADEAPEGYAGGESLWLARTADGWVVVDAGGWIT